MENGSWHLKGQTRCFLVQKYEKKTVNMGSRHGQTNDDNNDDVVVVVKVGE